MYRFVQQKGSIVPVKKDDSPGAVARQKRLIEILPSLEEVLNQQMLLLSREGGKSACYRNEKAEVQHALTAMSRSKNSILRQTTLPLSHFMPHSAESKAIRLGCSICGVEDLLRISLADMRAYLKARGMHIPYPVEQLYLLYHNGDENPANSICMTTHLLECSLGIYENPIYKRYRSSGGRRKVSLL